MRLASTLILILSLFLAPWWLFTLLILAAVYLNKSYFEAVFFAYAFLLLYTAVAAHTLWALFVFLGVLLFENYVRPNLRVNEKYVWQKV